MTEPVKASYIMNDKNYHGAYATHLWKRQKAWIITRSILCVLMIAFGGYLMVVDMLDKVFGYAFVTAGSVGFLRPLIWQMWHGRGMRKHPSFGSKIRYTFTKEGVEVDGKKGRYEIEWEKVYELVSGKRGKLVYLSKKQYFWLPNSCISSADWDIIRATFESSRA